MNANSTCAPESSIVSSDAVVVGAVQDTMAEEDEQQTKVIDEKFKDEMFHKLNELRTSNFLCDTTVRAEGQDFAAHRNVLSAASDYFKALFGSDLKVKEKQRNLVELNDMKSTIIAEVLQFIYTGEASINSSNAQDLVVASDYLIIPSLKSKASQFLAESLNASNCLALESFACQYNCDTVKQAAVKYKYQHFVAVVKSEGFLSLGFDQVKELICKDELNISEEEQVYEAVMAWIKHDLSSRECLLPDLLKCLRLFSMSKYSLRKILNKEELVKKNPICSTVLNNGLDFFLFPDRFLGKSLKHRNSIENEEHVVVLTGGQDEDGVLFQDIDCFVLATEKWQPLSRMPDSCLSKTRGSLYVSAVSGGRLFGMCSESTILSCFDPKENAWKSKKTNLRCPKDCTLTSLNEELFLIGGMCQSVESTNEVSGKIHKYNSVCNEWKQLASMETGRARHCAAVIEDLIYVAAGHDGQACLKSVEYYDPSANQWRRTSDLAVPRVCAAAITTSGKIFVVGGYQNMNNTNIQLICELFDPCLNQWSLVSSPTFPRAACGIVCVDETLYVFGGEDDEHILHYVECFDIKCKLWRQLVENMPKHRTFVQASLLRVPKVFIRSLCSN